VHLGDPAKITFRATYEREQDAAALLRATEGRLRVGATVIEIRAAPPKAAAAAAARTSDWTCRKCGCANYVSRLECRLCGDAGPPAPDAAEWICRRCVKSNSAARADCRGCSEARDDVAAGPQALRRAPTLPPTNGVPTAVDMAPDGFEPHTSGYWVNPATGFFFDTKTSYYFVFDAPTQRFLFWDYSERRYRVYPPSSLDASNASSAPTAEVAPTETPAAAAAAAVPTEYKAGSKPLKMTFGAKKAATNIAQWSRMKELDAAAQAAAPPLVLDAFVKATEEDESAVAAAEAEAVRRRVRHQGRAPVADAATQARPVSTIFSSLGRGPKNPTAASVPTALAEPALAPPVLLTAASVVELTATRGAVGKYETLTSLASGNVACTLCLRQFAARDKAERHVELSQLHASNAEARDNATREAVALLAERARQRELRQAEDRRTVRLREKEARDEMLAVERRLSERAAAKAAAAGSGSAQYDAMGPQIGEDNVGNKLLRKMGWREGSGLGAQGSGIVVPVQASGVSGNNKAGLGSAQSSSSRFGIDDERQRQLEQAFFGTD
jgi:hypothetical protein